MDKYQVAGLIVVVSAFTVLFGLAFMQTIEMDQTASEYYSCKACTKCYAYEEVVRYGWVNEPDNWQCACYNQETDEWTGKCNVTSDGRVIFGGL